MGSVYEMVGGLRGDHDASDKKCPALQYESFVHMILALNIRLNLAYIFAFPIDVLIFQFCQFLQAVNHFFYIIDSLPSTFLFILFQVVFFIQAETQSQRYSFFLVILHDFFCLSTMLLIVFNRLQSFQQCANLLVYLFYSKDQHNFDYGLLVRQLTACNTKQANQYILIGLLFFKTDLFFVLHQFIKFFSFFKVFLTFCFSIPCFLLHYIIQLLLIQSFQHIL